MSCQIRVEVRTDPRPLGPLDPAVPRYVSTGNYTAATVAADVAQGLPLAAHIPLSQDAAVVEITVLYGFNGDGGRAYAAFGSPGDPTAEPRFLIDGKRTLHVPSGTDLALRAGVTQGI